MGRRAVLVDPNAYAYGLRRSQRDPNLKTTKSLVSTKTIPITPAKGEPQAPPTMSVWATEIKKSLTFMHVNWYALFVDYTKDKSIADGIHEPYANKFLNYFEVIGHKNDLHLQVTLPQHLGDAKDFNLKVSYIYSLSMAQERMYSLELNITFTNPLAIFPYNRRKPIPKVSPSKITGPAEPITPEHLKELSDNPLEGLTFKFMRPKNTTNTPTRSTRPRGDRGTLNTPLYRDPHRPVFDNSRIPFPDLDEYADDYLVSGNTESSAPKTDGRKEKTGSHGAKGRPSAKYYFPGGYKTYNKTLKEWNEQHDGVWVSPMRGSQAWETIRRMARIRMDYDPTTRDKVHEAVLGTRKQ